CRRVFTVQPLPFDPPGEEVSGRLIDELPCRIENPDEGSLPLFEALTASSATGAKSLFLQGIVPAEGAEVEEVVKSHPGSLLLKGCGVPGRRWVARAPDPPQSRPKRSRRRSFHTFQTASS